MWDYLSKIGKNKNDQLDVDEFEREVKYIRL
jgi:hypothetical protein